MSKASISENQKARDDTVLNLTLRPLKWNDYIGQELVKKNITLLIEAARKRGDPLEHILLSGPAGLGKTSLAHLISREMNTNIRITSGPAVERVGDLASVLTNLLPRDILFIDEVHRLNKLVEEVLYPAMESRSLDIIIGKGPSARTIQIELPPFTLIAATTRIGLLSSPLRSRFGASFRLNFYSLENLEDIMRRSAQILKVPIQPTALKVLAQSARFTPRVANRLLKRARDYAEVYGDGVITEEVAIKTLELLEIDNLGLDPMDRKILETMITKFGGGPVGIQTLSAATTEEEDTIAEVYEPYLMQLGFLERTPRGRVVTESAYRHVNLKIRPQEPLLS